MNRRGADEHGFKPNHRGYYLRIRSIQSNLRLSASRFFTDFLNLNLQKFLKRSVKFFEKILLRLRKFDKTHGETDFKNVIGDIAPELHFHTVA